MNADAHHDEAPVENAEGPTARLPLVGEATRPAARKVLAAGRPSTPDMAYGAAPGAPIVALHGVGQFEHGDVVGEIARQPVFARGGDFRRDTVLSRDHRYTLLMDGQVVAGVAPRTRMLEVNWSDVRRAMPNLLGLSRNFVTLLLALNRIGVEGAYRSRSLSVHIRTGVLSLWLVEALLVWAALAPALSVLLWQLDQGERMAAGMLVASGGLYTAWLVRDLSVPLAAGGVLFAGFSGWAGWWTCFGAGGHEDFAAQAALVHTYATLLTASAVLASAVEVILRRRTGTEEDVRWVHRLARVGCLWLPLAMLVLLQPLTVTSMLLPMSPAERTRWGIAFASQMPFDPHDGQLAAGWIAVVLAGTLVVGAVQFKSVQRYGRNLTVWMSWGIGASILALAQWLDVSAFVGCDLCRQCLRTDWLGAAGLMLFIGATLTWVLFARSDVARDPRGRGWYPAGAFARFWASIMLAAMPLALSVTLGWLWWQAIGHRNEAVLADASEVFLQSTKYALLLSPLATKPFAAFLDALGDVFFFLVRQRNLSTRHDTQPRLWQAIRHLDAEQAAAGSDARERHIVVFAHSQGTIIAAGMLSRMVRVLERSSLRITLVTVGSPLTTLYRNFLGARLGEGFAQLCREQPQRFRWFNLYRPADYIGGEIELDGVVNRDLLTPGDHVGYWSDRELLNWLKALSQDCAE
jgi:hypothetical protein